MRFMTLNVLLVSKTKHLIVFLQKFSLILKAIMRLVYVKEDRVWLGMAGCSKQFTATANLNIINALCTRLAFVNGI